MRMSVREKTARSLPRAGYAFVDQTSDAFVNTPPDDDGSAFRDAMRGIRRHAPSERAAPHRRLPAPEPRHSTADERAVIAELLSGPDPDAFESGDTLSYRAPGVQEGVLRQLRRRNFRIDGELDLHGLNQVKARAAVVAFIAHCRDRDWRCVRIIHGKGNGSPNSGPVIKQRLDGWLRKVRDVMAFCSARPEDGGTGAVYVLLRRP
jgi:DNA-nicking Smr family endonuclease